jgi:glycogen debranching enzyme
MSRVHDLRVRPELRYIANGWSTLVTDSRGLIRGTGPQGFFARNTRVLNCERITVDGREPEPFSSACVGAYAQLSYAELRGGETLPSEALYLTIERFVASGLRSRLTVHSWAAQPTQVVLAIGLGADFADSEEAESGQRRQEAPVVDAWDPATRELQLRYEHPDLDRAVSIRFESPVPVAYAAGELSLTLPVQAGGHAGLDVVVEPVFDGRRMAAPPGRYTETDDAAGQARTVLDRELTRLRSTNLEVAAAWDVAVHDLATLPLGEPPGPAAPIAGLPVYQQLFGRDTLTASWQALLAGPTMLRDSLLLAAARIGERVDDWRDEQPGKLLHQARYGPLSVLGLNPFTAYYGDWATPVDFLGFLGQYLTWTNDRRTVGALLPAARRVLRWLSEYGDEDRDGFLEYRRRSPGGGKNQGWKDSDTAIVDEDGNDVPNPLATSELQAYHYAALRHIAAVFAAFGEPVTAARLLARARRLRRRFHAAYWMPERGSYAVALDREGRQVRSVNSNDGHLLATGIVPRAVARGLARRLLAPDMFSGWGIRTLSADHPAYNPFSYHRGSVWPVEAATIGLGLARYGCFDELHRLAEATFAAAALFDGYRLPEVLGGLPRDDDHPHPGVYPRACSPQAWSASSVVGLVQAILALRPVAAARTVLIDPHLPEWLPDLHLRGVRVGGATFDLSVRRDRRGRIRIRTSGDRITVLRQPTLQARTAR